MTKERRDVNIRILVLFFLCCASAAFSLYRTSLQIQIIFTITERSSPKLPSRKKIQINVEKRTLGSTHSAKYINEGPQRVHVGSLRSVFKRTYM